MFQLKLRGISVAASGSHVASPGTAVLRESLRAADEPWSLQFRHGFPGEIRNEIGDSASAQPAVERWNLRQLQSAMAKVQAVTEFTTEEEEDNQKDDTEDQTLAMLQLLIEPLERVRLDPFEHPEGDALYHTLQVFELGRHERPYDEEFLLACLLHDVGLAVNRRHPVLSALDALGNLVTERTRFLIEARPVAAEYLRTGVAPKSLRKSDDFEEALLLARCDRDGRVAGAQVCTLDEAFDYIVGLQDEWDDD